MKKNFCAEKSIFKTRVKQSIGLAFVGLTTIATAWGCGREKETKTVNEAPPAERVEKSAKVDGDGCRTLTEAICVIPGDEGKCLAFNLVDVKVCPKKQ